MPSNVFNENGEQTHVMLELDEYRRMVEVEERLTNIRRFAQGMLEQVGDLPEPENTVDSGEVREYEAQR